MNISSDLPVVVITGTSTGIGKSLAALLVESGWRVVATARRPQAAVAGWDQRLLDVCDDKSVRGCIDGIARDYGRLDAVVNNAGAGHLATLEEDSLDDIRKVFEVNFFGVVRVSQAALPHLRKSKGRLVTVTSVGGVVGQPFNDGYCAAKFAVEGMMEGLAPVARGAGVRVSVVEPGYVTSEFVANLGFDLNAAGNADSPYQAMREHYLERVRQRLPQGQTCEATAAVIRDVLADPNPKFRYQTSEAAKMLVGLKLTDMTGEAVQAFTSSWIAGPTP